MREIKFRAWDNQFKNMIYECNEAQDDMDILDIFSYYKRDYIFMQYTGLKDKNGKEIYEGDFLRDTRGCINEVKFEDGTWSYAYSIWEMAEEPSEEWEIIGNIYENSELIEKQ